MKGFYFFLIFSFLFYSKTSNLKLNVKEKGKGLMGFIIKRKNIISLSFLAFHTLYSIASSSVYEELSKKCNLSFIYYETKKFESPCFKSFLYGFIPFYYSIFNKSNHDIDKEIKKMNFILPFYLKVDLFYKTIYKGLDHRNN